MLCFDIRFECPCEITVDQSESVLSIQVLIRPLAFLGMDMFYIQITLQLRIKPGYTFNKECAAFLLCTCFQKKCSFSCVVFFPIQITRPQRYSLYLVFF